MATAQTQGSLFPTQVDERVSLSTSSTFISNMDLPVHRWIRYSAGFSAEWVESVISEARPSLGEVRVFDPFCGSGTTLVASETAGVEAWGIEAHPFVFRIAHAKLAWRSDPDAYLRKIADLLRAAREVKPNLDEYPSLIRKCYDRDALLQLDKLRRAFEHVRDD
ncbi:MAG: DNA methyltransferase, partial [Candidatus Acidiferrales bacterium]